MEDKKRLTLARLVIGGIIFIVIIAVVVILMIKMGNKTQEDTTPEENQIVMHVVDIEGEENVKIDENEVKVNTSEQVKEEQNINGIVISNASIKYENGVSTIKADITNNTGKDIKELGIIKIKVKDSTGRVAREVSTYVMDIAKGETKAINANITSEIVNAQDLEFSI